MIDQISRNGIVPVAAIESVDDGLKLSETFVEAGLPVIEVTFRTDAAEGVIRAVSQRFPQMLIGAGTILNVDHLIRAFEAGARFAVAPGTNPVVVQAAIERGFPFLPGVCTPSDVEQAVALGCKTLKFFPAGAAGGVKMLKALIGPYGHLGLKFCPTGGIKAENMLDYLALKEVFAVGGTWLAAKSLMGNWEAIRTLTRDAVERVQKARR